MEGPNLQSKKRCFEDEKLLKRIIQSLGGSNFK